MSGLFETIRVREGTIPFREAHLVRLRAGLATFGLPALPAGIEERLADHARAGEAVLRLTADVGGPRIETRPVPKASPMRIVISGTRHEPYPLKRTERGVFERARERVVPFRADEVLLLTGDGFLAEGCITSVFFWVGDTLCTPGLDLGILPGIGRARVLELAARRSIRVREGGFLRAEFEGLSLFLVNAVRGIVEITRHGEWRPPRDERTARLAAAFWG